MQLSMHVAVSHLGESACSITEQLCHSVSRHELMQRVLQRMYQAFPCRRRIANALPVDLRDTYPKCTILEGH